MSETVILVAHPDDEVIFGWPALKQAKRIVCCSSDLNNPERKWCKDRKKALYEIGDLLGIRVDCLDYNSEFYRVNSRDGSLWNLAKDVLSLLQSADCVYTHNPWGEYGHIDHILVHQIARMAKRRILYSDMCLEAGWLPCTSWQSLAVQVKFCENDLSFYERCKAVYDKWGCWTWSKEPITTAMIYEDN